MIISASRRTDLPAHYADWFFNQLREGFVLVRNPFQFHQVSRIALSPDVVDCFVFWTKNPAPLLNRLDRLADYPYYFQFTLTPYGQEVEGGVPEKFTALTDLFRRLSDQVGPDRVVWRYDPVFLSENYPADFHFEAFDRLANRLKGFTDQCVFSFLDFYPGIAQNISSLGVLPWTAERKREIAAGLSKIAQGYGLTLSSCAEEMDLNRFCIRHARCIDPERIAKISGFPIRAAADRSQRPACGCAESIDIGAYGSCLSGCKYCYAKKGNAARGDPLSPLLGSALAPEDSVTIRKMRSLADRQLSLFEHFP